MNILFCTIYEVTPYQGGTERITHRIACAFKRHYKYNCYLSYHTPYKHEIPKTIFKETIHITKCTTIEELSNFINNHSINYIIIQGVFDDVLFYRKAIKNSSKCKIIFTHHFEPMAEKNFFLFKDILYDALENKALKKYFKILLYPFLRKKYLKNLPLKYQNAYNYSDKTVLLMDDFIVPYIQYANLLDNKKFTSIPNMLSYNEYCSLDEITKKEKTILIVSRFDERFKRILLALNIWKTLKKHPCTKEWNLKIIGSGNDYIKYVKYIKRNNIQDVHFLGQQDPIEYYKKASIFLMTSISESWGLTITEAQQFGVIPIAFACFPSLREIITNEINGFSIPEKEVNSYVQTLIDLINNASKRKEIAINCINSTKRFSEEIIIEKWNNLLLEL